MITLLEHIVPNNFYKKVRLYDYIGEYFKSRIPSRKGLKKAISRGEVLINSKRASSGDWITAEQIITLVDLELTPPKPYPLDLEIAYEDEHFAVINKPAGISVSGNQYRTIQNVVINQIKLSTETDALKWARPVHRLDNPTSGLLILAKTRSMLKAFDKMFKQQQIQKTYHAIVIGLVRKPQTIKSSIEDKESISDLRPIESVRSLKNDHLTLVDLFPKTGRTHQLRIHCASINHPIMGDQQYGEEGKVFTEKGLFLSAVKLEFQHPVTKQLLQIAIETPHKFKSLLDREQRRWEKYN